MPARQGFILFITDQEKRKSARPHRLHRRNFRQREAGEFFSAIQQRPRERTQQRLPEPGRFAQPSIVVSRFAKIGERGFGDYGFDAWIRRGGL